MILFFPVFFDAGEAFDMTLPMYCAISNIICSMVYGNRYDYDDPVFKSLVENTRRRTELMFSPSVQVLYWSEAFNFSTDTESIFMNTHTAVAPAKEKVTFFTFLIKSVKRYYKSWSIYIFDRCTTSFHGSSNGLQTGRNSTDWALPVRNRTSSCSVI